MRNSDEFYFRQQISSTRFIKNNHLPMWSKDYTKREGRILWVSEGYANLLGQAPQDCIGKLDSDLWPQDLAKLFKQHGLEAIENGESQFKLECSDPRVVLETSLTVFKSVEEVKFKDHSFIFVHGIAVPNCEC